MSKTPDRQRRHNRQQEIVEGMSEEQAQRLKERKREKRREEQKAHKHKYLPLLRFMKKNGLKFKTAAVNKKTVEYFRIDQFELFLETKKQKISADARISGLLQNWRKIFLYYQRLENQPSLKWPQQLQQIKQSSGAKFASFRFDSNQSSKMTTVGLVVGVIAVVLFPLWPYELKYFLFKVSLYLLLGILGLSAVRLAIYGVGAVFGVSVWLFPNLYQNDTTWQTFKPVFSVQKWKGNSTEAIIVRLLLLSLFFYYGYHIYSDPNLLTENIQITRTLIDDAETWAVSKLKGQKNFSQSALTDYSHLLNQTIQEEAQKTLEF